LINGYYKMKQSSGTLAELGHFHRLRKRFACSRTENPGLKIPNTSYTNESRLPICSLSIDREAQPTEPDLHDAQAFGWVVGFRQLPAEQFSTGFIAWRQALHGFLSSQYTNRRGILTKSFTLVPICWSVESNWSFNHRNPDFAAGRACVPEIAVPGGPYSRVEFAALQKPVVAFTMLQKLSLI
jgi:hypothetical protein